jgi:hypothetical protein
LLSNGALLLTARCGVRQAGAALAHAARPAAFCFDALQQNAGALGKANTSWVLFSSSLRSHTP